MIDPGASILSPTSTRIIFGQFAFGSSVQSYRCIENRYRLASVTLLACRSQLGHASGTFRPYQLTIIACHLNLW
jgi:hypothetical protein